MSYYDVLEAGVNDSPLDGPEHCSGLGAAERSHFYSHGYNADQWWACREVPRERERLRFAAGFAGPKKGFGGAIAGGQDAPMRDPGKTIFDATPKAVEKPRPEGCPHEAGSRMEHVDLETGAVTRVCAACGAELEAALVVPVPKQPSDRDHFDALPDDGDPDGGIFEAAPAGNPLEGLEWTSPGDGLPPPPVAAKLQVHADPATDRHVCETWPRPLESDAVHADTIEAAVAGWVAGNGLAGEGVCVRVHEIDTGETFWWAPGRGEILREADGPAPSGCPAARLEFAAKRGDVGGVRAALEALRSSKRSAAFGAHVLQSALDWSLCDAAKAGHVLASSYLIDQGADPAAKASHFLARAVDAGQAEAAELLLARGAREADLAPDERDALVELLGLDPSPPAPRYPGMALPGKLLWVAALLEGLAGEAEAVAALETAFDLRPADHGPEQDKGFRVAWAHPSAASPEARERGERFDLCVNGGRPPRLVVGRGRKLDAWELRESKEAAQ